MQTLQDESAAIKSACAPSHDLRYSIQSIMRKSLTPILALMLTHSCSPLVQGDLTSDLEDSVPLSAYRLFTTSSTYGTSLLSGTGVTALDTVCETEARAAGLTRRYRALAADSADPSTARFSWNKPIYVVSVGQAILLSTSLEAAISGAGPSLPPRYDASGDYIASGSARVMTGFTSTGSLGSNCNDWTATDAGTQFNDAQMTLTTTRWIGNAIPNVSCTSTNSRLYCLGD